ncbi:neutral and basic amino acid transport protein rBAT-like [Daktulosphaira vitifoliae]|uniref:neutral and basic amino acid transport protein rBAT-like n=1 Tax=Daktulosphaira vitifoliae TaxID=58002 RepID=UPI0021A9E331|nr:neutral and basic amino acid transport protein rBAT-like [Daktulosphaira vitifoliae]
MSIEKEDGAVEKLMEDCPKQEEPAEEKYDKLKNFDMSDDVEKAYAGMGKEELMKYANSPFWVRLRLLLFIAFWLSWFAMMFGALFIIFMAPKCFPQQNIEWYQRTPVYVINATNIGLEELDEKIDYFKKLGVENIVLSSEFKFAHDQVADFLVDFSNSSFVSHNSTKDLITKLKAKGMKVLIKIIPNHSTTTNPLFLRSILKETPYKDYYIWKSGVISNMGHHPPNNWLSITGGSMWTWNDRRKEYYLHQFSEMEPDFNFHNKDVVNYFENLFKFWLDNGVDGFYLDKVQYLFEDKEFKNDTRIPVESILTNNNAFTSYLPESYDLLSKWGKFIIENSNSGILIVGDIDNKNITGVNIAHSSIALPKDFAGEQLLQAILLKRTSSQWPSWEWICSDCKDSWPREINEAFNILSSILQGVPIIYADNNIFENNIIPNVTFIESTLKDLRATPTIEFGTFNAKLISDNVLVIDRVISSSESYIFVWNLNKNSTNISLLSFKDVPKEASLILCTESACPTLPPLKSKVNCYNMSIAAQSAIVLKF